MILDVTWGGGGTENGSGQVHVWAKIGFSASSNTLSASGQTCGRVLPPATLTLNLGTMLIEIPDGTWELPSMPRFTFSATQSGWNVGSTLSYGYTALVGISATDPTANPINLWPVSYTAIASVDADGDGSPGITAVPRDGNGFVLPPTANLMNRVDKLYLALRSTMWIMSTRSACDTASGTATFTHFDSHVLGCHVSGGQNCGDTDTALVDLNRTTYQVTSATIQSKIVADAATCADVRAALPMN